MSSSSPAYVITVSGVSGSGKSSTVRAIANRLGNASCFYFDDYGEAMQQPEDGLRWIAAGADLTEFVLPQFGTDVHRLKHGEAVVTPTKRRVEPAPFLVIEEPFGSGRTDMAGLVDFRVCIEAPMEVALARRLLDAAERWDGTAEQRLQWLSGYLNSYLFEGMREVYIAINERVKEQADLILDGTLPVEENAQRVIESVTHRYGLEGIEKVRRRRIPLPGHRPVGDAVAPQTDRLRPGQAGDTDFFYTLLEINRP